jgi:hypothetical protein
MKAFLWLMPFAIATSAIYAETPKDLFQFSISSLEDASGSANEAASFSRLESAWAQLPQADKAAAWPQMSLAYVDESSKRLDAKDAVTASRYLALAGALNQSFGGRLEYATKSPNAFFERLARMQTEIASKTGSDPLAGMVNYLFQKDGDEYIVARQEFDPEVNGVTIDGLSESESLVQVHYFNAKEGKVTLENTRWFIGPKGKVADTLNRATREVLQDQYGRFEPKPIRNPILSGSVQAKEIKLTAQSTLVPPAAMPVQKSKLAPSPMPTEETKSTLWPWIIGAILFLAVAGGILFKFLRR